MKSNYERSKDRIFFLVIKRPNKLNNTTANHHMCFVDTLRMLCMSGSIPFTTNLTFSKLRLELHFACIALAFMNRVRQFLFNSLSIRFSFVFIVHRACASFDFYSKNTKKCLARALIFWSQSIYWNLQYHLVDINSKAQIDTCKLLIYIQYYFDLSGQIVIDEVYQLEKAMKLVQYAQ